MQAAGRVEDALGAAVASAHETSARSHGLPHAEAWAPGSVTVAAAVVRMAATMADRTAAAAAAAAMGPTGGTPKRPDITTLCTHAIIKHALTHLLRLYMIHNSVSKT